MLIGEITLNEDCFASKYPSSSAEDLFLQVTSNPSVDLYIEQTTVRLLVKGTFKRQIEKVKIKGFAPTPFISLSSGAYVTNILNQKFCLSLLAN